MAKKNKFNDVDGLQDEYCYDAPTELEDIEYVDAELLNTNTMVCKIIRLSSKTIQVDFNGYGISVKANNPEQYKTRKMIRVTYTGEIGKSDFKAWIE